MPENVLMLHGNSVNINNKNFFNNSFQLFKNVLCLII